MENSEFAQEDVILGTVNPFRLLILLLVWLICLPCSLGAQRVGLVLSGGGATGMAHIGVLKALEENGIPIDYITGTSAGALVGGMYAAGYSPAEIEAMVTSEKFLRMSEGRIEPQYIYYFKQFDPSSGMVSLRLSKDSLKQTYLPTNLVSPTLMDYEMMTGFSSAAAAAGYNFDSLFVPFRCVASDIVDKKSVVFANGQLHTAVRASMSFPFYIKPLKVNGRLLFDGGLYNNFPADVMYDVFLPDIMIGSNVSGNTPLPDEDNIMSQIRNMIVTLQDFELRCDNGIIIQPQSGISTFDFASAREAIDAGYRETIKNIDSIRKVVGRTVDPAEIKARREAFRKKCPPLEFDQIEVEGITKNQQQFVQRTLVKRKEKSISEQKLKPRYFRVGNDDHIAGIYPTAIYNPATGKYNLKLDIKKEKEFNVEFGGNFSSRPINTGYVGLQAHFLGRSAWTVTGRSWFGKFYAAGYGSIRYEPPTKLPFYIEPEFTLQRRNYFKSFSTFFEDVKPSYIIQTEQQVGLNLGFPVGNRGKLVVNGKYAELIDDYYQTQSFLSIDTSDQTKLYAASPSVYYEINTLNKKQYANEGMYVYFGAKGISAWERSIPGSTALNRDTSYNYHKWFHLKAEFQNYYKSKGWFRLGVHFEGVYSIQPFLNNYTATILSAPYYHPIPESKTLFISNLRAFQYVAAGHQIIFHVKKNIDWRLEAYAFQPFSRIESGPDNQAQYGELLKKRYLIASTAIVYHSPFGPASVSFNYYPDQDRPFSLLFNMGYIIFPRHAIK
ncbi:MAG TPA: patatin-like phospholipase family protein [Flavobacteriales bacterium]|nr:patatin-like phospholipase family protein [Flavobacteriales bacterium]HRJ39006.1 patatin-like phospholipase family protein [Flavobacteriales bacterium]